MRKRQTNELVCDDASQYFSSDSVISPQTLEVKAGKNHKAVAEKRLEENGKDTCLDHNPEKIDGTETSVPSLCVQSPSESEGEEEGVDEKEENGSRQAQRVEGLSESEQSISKGQPEPNEEEERLQFRSQNAGESECLSPTRSSSEHGLCASIT